MCLYLSHGNTLWSYTGFEDFKGMLSESLEDSDEMNYLEHYMGITSIDGGISPECLEDIIPQVRKTIRDWDEEDDYRAFQKGMGSEFIKAMEDAVAKNEPLKFN